MSVDKIVIVADDLTGACDSGVAFLATGRRARVVLNESSMNTEVSRLSQVPGNPEVWAFTTETRDMPPEQAGERVSSGLTAFGPILDSALLFKKIDSAARGNFGVEISAALDCSRAVLALVAPAFPATGRTVKAGVLTVRDWSGQDVSTPLRDQFQHVPPASIEVLSAGPEQLLQQGIARALRNGTRILLCDATTEADLEELAAAGLKTEQPLLWAGSAGLAHALAGELCASTTTAAALQPARRVGEVLLFVGTPHPVTSLQIAHLEQKSRGMNRTVHRIPGVAASEQEVITAFATRPVASLILTGGDTASFVLHALGASSIELAGEIARGIPWGFIEGGMADGCVVVTKSGGFGEREALAQAFEFCERRFCDPA
jgi:uncharacterized protein YgbK (DUF1537 family)